MSKFDDMIDWATGYTRAVNERKVLELKEREVRALELLATAQEKSAKQAKEQIP